MREFENFNQLGSLRSVSTEGSTARVFDDHRSSNISDSHLDGSMNARKAFFSDSGGGVASRIHFGALGVELYFRA